MPVKDDLEAASERKRRKAAAAASQVDPTVTVNANGRAQAAQVVLGLAQELNSDSIKLPGFPDVVTRIQRALADPKPSVRDVVKLVASEPTLAARLVHLANAAVFNKSRREVSDLRTAINSLGFNIVRSQATSFAVRQMQRLEWLVPMRPLLADIWKTSNGIAALSYAVAKQVPGVQPDEAMAAGLFHLLGKLYLLARARQESLDPTAIVGWEKAINEWHATIARTILDYWKVPTRIAEAVENQGAIFDADSHNLAPLTHVLCAAQLHYRLRRPNAAPEPEAEEALAQICLHGKPFTEIARVAQADAEAARVAIS